MSEIDIVFDGPPDSEAGRFVEVESPPGIGIRLGEWLQRPDGFWVLRFENQAAAEIEHLKAELARTRQSLETMAADVMERNESIAKLYRLQAESETRRSELVAKYKMVKEDLAVEREKVVRLQKALRRAGHCLESGFTKNTVILDIRDALAGKNDRG